MSGRKSLRLARLLLATAAGSVVLQGAEAATAPKQESRPSISQNDILTDPLIRLLDQTDGRLDAAHVQLGIQRLYKEPTTEDVQGFAILLRNLQDLRLSEASLEAARNALLDALVRAQVDQDLQTAVIFELSKGAGDRVELAQDDGQRRRRMRPSDELGQVGGYQS